MKKQILIEELNKLAATTRNINDDDVYLYPDMIKLMVQEVENTQFNVNEISDERTTNHLIYIIQANLMSTRMYLEKLKTIYSKKWDQQARLTILIGTIENIDMMLRSFKYINHKEKTNV